MVERLRSGLALVALLAAEAGVLALVVWGVDSGDPIDWSHPARWLAAATPDTLCVEAGRIIAFGLGAWMFATTLVAVGVGVAGAVTGRDGLPARLARVTPAAVRRVVEGVLAVGIVAGAVTPIAPLGPVRDGRAPVTTVAPPALAPTPTTTATTPTIAAAPVGGAAAATAASVSAPAPLAHVDAPAPGTRTVQAGESLWTIAQDEVLHAHGSVDLDAVARYWRVLCERNRSSLRSGDVNLVAPGETLELPPVA